MITPENVKKPVPIRQADNYIKEVEDTLNRLQKENEKLPEFSFFLETAYKWFSNNIQAYMKPKVVILGTDVPEELILAAGAQPYWLLGGSLGSVAWSDEMVPRDTDPVSRSILGFINQPGGRDYSDSLFIVPLTNDSMRKIAYQLKDEGRKIFTVDIPPDRDNRRAIKQWQKQMHDIMAAVADHTGTRVTRERVISARRQTVMARKTLYRFIELSKKREDILTASARILVRNSYYYTDNLNEWTEQLTGLCFQLQKMSARIHPRYDRPGVVIMGSPVFFPNYKVPFLIHETGLDIQYVVDETELKLRAADTRRIHNGGRDRIIRAIAAEKYIADASPAFVKNNALFRYTERLLRRGNIEGVVYHVLKGQIEYDFELERFEALFSSHGIPVFRLETDYQYQDVEQLRIRMEAFSEMLVQNRYREEKKAL